MMRALFVAVALVLSTPAMAQDAKVIEVVTVNLKDGVSVDAFVPVDAAVEEEHVSKQPGFVSRETAVNGRTWLVIVHWKSVEEAQASMDSFAGAPAAAKFMSMLDVSTMKMTRYTITP